MENIKNKNGVIDLTEKYYLVCTICNNAEIDLPDQIAEWIKDHNGCFKLVSRESETLIHSFAREGTSRKLPNEV